MSNLEEALAIARASIPYFQQQHDRGQNNYTLTRLENAKRTVRVLEAKA